MTVRIRGVTYVGGSRIVRSDHFNVSSRCINDWIGVSFVTRKYKNTSNSSYNIVGSRNIGDCD